MAVVGSTLRAMSEMLKNEAIKGPSPKRNKIAVAVGAVVVAGLVAGGVFGVNAANAYRADIEAAQTAAADYYDAAAQQNELAQAAADRAEGFAEDAGEAVTSTEAAEAEAAAIAEAEAAAQAAAASENEAPTYGEYPSGTHVPFVKSSDPEDASGGYYDTGACASNSASTIGGVPVCD